MIILAIDPGKDKCGYAVVNKEKKVYEKGVILTSNLKTYLNKSLNKYSISQFVLGDGTNSDLIKNILLNNFSLPISMVNEDYTTLEAEKRYRQENSKGLKKIFSFITWRPSEPVDDFVAVLLAERFLEDNT